MKVAILEKGNLNKFEQDLAIALQKINLEGYALIGFEVRSGFKHSNIDAFVILESGIFACLEAKGYEGKWEGGINQKWFADGKEIKSSGINPFAQVQGYSYAVKNKLQTIAFFQDIDLPWVNALIVAPDLADFSGVEGARLNQSQIGKSISICHLSGLGQTFTRTRSNEYIAEKMQKVGIEQLISQIFNISGDRLKELTISDFGSDLQSLKTPEDRVAKPIRRPFQNIQNRFVINLSSFLLAFASLIFISFFGFKFWQFTTKPHITINALKVGILTDPEKYKSLQTYLEDELIVDDFWRFIKGDRLKVTIDGDKTLQYEEAKTRIAAKDWDLAFTLSPMNSVAAKDNNYYYLARMFPNNPPFYKSALIVKHDSKINSITDLNSQSVIAMGAIGSASSFFMPSYDLYGKALIVKKDHRSQKIIEMVKSGEADIGTVAYNDELIKDGKIRVIRQSRDIPGSGLYLSPKLSLQDRAMIAKALLNAPSHVQTESNYGSGQEVDYADFLKIVRRVEEILSCSDFTKNPVMFFCPDAKIVNSTNSNGNLQGTVNGFRVPAINMVWLNLEGQDRLIYRVVISRALLNQIPQAGSPLSLQNKKVEIKNVSPRQLEDGTLEIVIKDPQQFKVF